MIEFHRITVATITTIVLCAVSLWATAVAQDVFDSSIVIEPPKPADAKVVDKFRKALSDPSEAQGSEDPILDEMIDIIRQRGSVLDGSSLDPNSEVSPSVTSDPIRSSEAGSKTLAAERLLKAARLLEQVEPQNRSRIELVREMRRETVRLLSE